MSRKPSKFKDVLPVDRPVLVVGNYGSGKTEVAVNLAIHLREAGLEVQLADLDIVNPYFRCREARALMEHHGIRVVVPPGSQAWADLPIVLPEIQGMLHPDAPGVRLFDVGGDDVGARILSSFAGRLERPAGVAEGAFDRYPYALWQVINARRPFTDSVPGCVRMMEAIERSSRLAVTGFIGNTHLVTETTPEVILEGYALARAVADETGRPLVFTTAMGALADDPAVCALEGPLLRLERHMLPPWVRPTDHNLPAGRTVPLGRRLGVD